MIYAVLQYSRHLTDAIRGEYRDRVMVQHAELRLCTQVFGVFDQFKIQVILLSLFFAKRLGLSIYLSIIIYLYIFIYVISVISII